MKLVADHAVYSEPHDSIIIPRNLVRTRQVYDINDFPNAVKDAKDCRVERKGKKVTGWRFRSTTSTSSSTRRRPSR